MFMFTFLDSKKRLNVKKRGACFENYVRQLSRLFVHHFFAHLSVELAKDDVEIDAQKLSNLIRERGEHRALYFIIWFDLTYK